MFASWSRLFVRLTSIQRVPSRFSVFLSGSFRLFNKFFAHKSVQLGGNLDIINYMNRQPVGNRKYTHTQLLARFLLRGFFYSRLRSLVLRTHILLRLVFYLHICQETCCCFFHAVNSNEDKSIYGAMMWMSAIESQRRTQFDPHFCCTNLDSRLSHLHPFWQMTTFPIVRNE